MRPPPAPGNGCRPPYLAQTVGLTRNRLALHRRCRDGEGSFRPPLGNRPHPLRACGRGDISPMTTSSATSDSFFNATLAEADPEIAAAIKGELGRQRHEIELIASENIVSRAVLEAQGSVMTNKYAEGYPGAHYY